MKHRSHSRSLRLKTENSKLKTKKSLGQNFLRNAYYLALIADAAHVMTGERVLEIGPGDGALTAELLSRGASVVAVEKDSRLIPVLREKFAKDIADKRLTLIEADALEFNPSDYQLTDKNPDAPKEAGTPTSRSERRGYKLVANIPYYITGALLRKFLSETPRPSLLVFLVQKEVAQRIARDKKESLLSLSVKAYGSPRYIKTVPRGAFSPAPAVDSAILSVENISSDAFMNAAHEQRFFELLHAGFAQKRKLLRRNVEKILGSSALEALKRAGIPEKARAEDVPIEKWLVLAEGGKRDM